MKRLYISVDFDGTIVEQVYPKVGELRDDSKYYINKLYEDGHTIIINTCRSGIYADEAKDFLLQMGVKFNYFNENAPELIKKYGGDCRKISADYYIDDRCIAGLPKWEDIYNLIQSSVYE